MLLSSSYTIEQVAYLCGFKDASTFSTKFRAQHGATPRGWRTHYGGAKRAGGTTGCFRKAAERARARRDGKPLPSMTRETLSEGDRAVMGHEMDHAFRKARIRGRLADRSSIADFARVWMESSS